MRYDPAMLRLFVAHCLLASGVVSASNGPAVTKAFIDSNGSIHIVTEDSREQTITPEKWQNGGGFSDVIVASDAKTVGWVANQMLTPLQGGTNYEYAIGVEVEVWRSGKVIQKISTDAYAIRDWIFLKDGEEVAIHTAPPHGQEFFDCTRFDTRTGKKLTHWSLDRRDYVVPEWAKQLLVNDLLPGPDEISDWFPQNTKPKTKENRTRK